MNKIIIILVILVIFSCENNDNNERFTVRHGSSYIVNMEARISELECRKNDHIIRMYDLMVNHIKLHHDSVYTSTYNNYEYKIRDEDIKLKLIHDMERGPHE